MEEGASAMAEFGHSKMSIISPVAEDPGGIGGT
jgi:hypothetical protein